MSVPREFDAYFWGIPLPTEFLEDFRELLAELKRIAPALELVDSKTPHITVGFLGRISLDEIDQTKEKVRKNVHSLEDEKLEISGVGSFDMKVYKVLFLKVSCPPALTKFNKLLVPGTKQKFYPHITVGGLAKGDYKLESKIMELLTKFEASFPLSELVLYGVQTNRTPEIMEQLAHIGI